MGSISLTLRHKFISCCLFCSVGPESIFHIFGSCEKLRVLWDIASETVLEVTGNSFDFLGAKRSLRLDLVCVDLGNNSSFEKMMIYFNTIINFSIWKERNAIKFEFERFGIDNNNNSDDL